MTNRHKKCPEDILIIISKNVLIYLGFLPFYEIDQEIIENQNDYIIIFPLIFVHSKDNFDKENKILGFISRTAPKQIPASSHECQKVVPINAHLVQSLDINVSPMKQ